jgi:segregation and condensation protein A
VSDPVNEAAPTIEAAPPAEAAARAPKVHGQFLDKLPEDLYIPPDALEVFLDAFEGPLDLLLYLIRRQNLNILDIPVLKITQQYIQYIELMSELKLELAAEYLVMAALLAEIKSSILLPRPPPDEAVEQGDPRMELVRRLQEYERFKTAGESIEKLPRVGRDVFLAQARPEVIPQVAQVPMPSLRELVMAFRDIMERSSLFRHHEISREPLSVRERMSRILSRVRQGPALFADLIDPQEGRLGVVVCFLAVLELARSTLVEVRQDGPFEPILLAPPGKYEAPITGPTTEEEVS